MVSFIYFDLDDTLLDHRRAERRALAELCETYEDVFGHLAVEEVQEVYHAHNVPLWQQYGAGQIDKATLKRLRFEHLLEALDVADANADAIGADYMDCYARHWHVPDEAARAFHALADRYPVGLLTNGFTEVQQAKLERFPALRERAAHVVISEEVGVMKPHPDLFAHAARLAGAAPASILYVGDSYHSDVRGALGAGWRMAWYTDDGQDVDGVFRFSDWDALLAWVGV